MLIFRAITPRLHTVSPKCSSQRIGSDSLQDKHTQRCRSDCTCCYKKVTISFSHMSTCFCLVHSQLGCTLVPTGGLTRCWAGYIRSLVCSLPFRGFSLSPTLSIDWFRLFFIIPGFQECIVCCCAGTLYHGCSTPTHSPITCL